MGAKMDFKKTLKEFYNPSKKGFHTVDVPDMNFLMIDGSGDPNSSVEYKQAVEALYSMSYGIKFEIKQLGIDYVVPPLEGLWWMEDMNQFSLANKYKWQWTMMIMQPEGVTAEHVEKVRVKVRKKLNTAQVSQARLIAYQEGFSVQILYTGPYEDEAPVIAGMHQYIAEKGYELTGKHHEIYLSDPRKTAPEKWKTLLRQPVRTK